MISPRQQRVKYVLADYLSTNIAWLLFNAIRFHLLEVSNGGFGSVRNYLASPTVATGQLLFPLVMLAIYWLSGYYNEVFRKSRIDEIVTTAGSAIIGALLIFFAVLLNDMSDDLTTDYGLFGLLFGLLFLFVYVPRWFITSAAMRRLASGEWGFSTLIIGAGHDAAAFTSRQWVLRSMGLKIAGFITVHGETPDPDAAGRIIGSVSEIDRIVAEHNIQRLIVMPRPGDGSETLTLINSLFSLELPIYILPDARQSLLSPARTQWIVGDPLIDVSRSEMPASTLNCKRVSDIAVSAIALIFLAPIIAVLAAAVKLDSKGPAFYRQQRIGYHKRPFRIIKLRTMRTDAESDGPALSHGDDDPRITRIGSFLRKYRLDELPQFWNVLCGEMSLVGPRPEREHYIRLIMERAPWYALLHQVRPGITSWGMVRYGYATTVDQMIERLRYDMLYLENISMSVDIKILLYTINTVLKGSGK